MGNVCKTWVAVLVVSGLAAWAASPTIVGASTPSNGSSVVATMSLGHEMTGYFKEVRLRKMHLVRPDLIPYPVVQEWYA
jgi:hypothetical protein